MSQDVRPDWIKEKIELKRSLDKYKSQFEEPRVIIMDIEEEYDYGEAKNEIIHFLVSASFGLLNEAEYEKFLKECPLDSREKREVECYWSLNRLFFDLGKSAKDKEELDKKFREKGAELILKKRDEGAIDFWDWYISQNELYKGAEYIAEMGFSQRGLK